MALFTTGIVVSSVLLRGGEGHPLYQLVDPAGTTALILVFAMMLLSVSGEGWLLPGPLAAHDRSRPEKTESGSPAPKVASAPESVVLLDSLRRLMVEDKIYREEGLNIAALAGRLGIPEYRLRRLINERLGYRNFTAFLNGYRLEDAMQALADPSQADVPILTIALDAGFQSIGPFNRAFKARAGVTPTEFRRQHLASTKGAGASSSLGRH